MKKAIALAVLLLLVPVFAAECEPGFEENLTLQVLDAKLRPIENASVQVTYQVDRTSGKGYATTNPKYTDSNGIVSFLVKNREILPDKVDCELTVITNYDTKKVESKVTAGRHVNIVPVQLDVYFLSIRAVDQNGNVLSGGTIRVRDFKETVPNSGIVNFKVGKGNVNATLAYGEGSITKMIPVTNDTEYYFEAGVYDLELYVLDDQNNPLEVDAQIGDKVIKTDERGYLTVKKLLNARPEIRTVYKGVERSADANLAIQSVYYIIYDIHAPKIGNLRTSYDNGEIYLDMTVQEEGSRASGLAPDGLKVQYVFAGSDYYAVVTQKDSVNYQAIIPGIDRSGVVEIKIDARDVEGNTRNVRGYFSVQYINETVGGGDGGGGDGGQGFTIEPLHIVAVGVFIIILLVAVKFIQQKLNEP